jgi:AraC-like DNA-binding protein/mannose-6-phosphate isomerase-like protein (cupin superfamily)
MVNDVSSLVLCKSSRWVDAGTLVDLTGAMSVMQPDPWTPVDPLGEALHFLRMSGAFYCKSEMSEPWGVELPLMDRCLSFHVVIEGRCRLEYADGSTDTALIDLTAGDLALVRDGVPHTLSSAEGVATPGILDLHHDYESERYAVLHHGGGGQSASLVCGAVRFDHPAAHRMTEFLPAVITIAGGSSAQTEWIRDTLRLMAVEARSLRPGGEAVLTRLADVLVIQAIRAWLQDRGAEHAGWLAALQDQQIGHALTLIHREPARQWTVETLARETSMSRSAFAARFTDLVGEPAIAYIRRWRMNMALDHLRRDDVSIAWIAAEMGYESEASFSRAFKRVLGRTPGAERRSSSRSASGV